MENKRRNSIFNITNKIFTYFGSKDLSQYLPEDDEQIKDNIINNYNPINKVSNDNKIINENNKTLQKPSFLKEETLIAKPKNKYFNITDEEKMICNQLGLRKLPKEFTVKLYSLDSDKNTANSMNLSEQDFNKFFKTFEKYYYVEDSAKNKVSTMEIFNLSFKDKYTFKFNGPEHVLGDNKGNRPLSKENQDLKKLANERETNNRDRNSKGRFSSCNNSRRDNLVGL